MFLRAELFISKPDNSIEIGIYMGSSLDFDAYTMEPFAMIADLAPEDSHQTFLNFHVHTFGCPTCPDEVKQTACVSDGKYCAFFPHLGDSLHPENDPEDYWPAASMYGSEV